MITDEGLSQLAREIVALGYNEHTAAHYAALIGDTPCLDSDGRVVVMEHGQVLARLRLKSFDEAEPLQVDDFPAAINALGLDSEEVCSYLRLIGGEPWIDESRDRVLLRQDGKTIAVIPFKCLELKPRVNPAE